MGILRTEREYELTRERLIAMRGASERQRATLREAGFPPDHIELAVQPLLVMQDQMKGELQWYDRARRGEILPLSDLKQIGYSLIALRLAKGLTQRQLAERLGINEAQVSKDEKNEYAGISCERAQRVIDAMGGSITVTVSPEAPAPEEWQLVEAPAR